MEVLNETTAEVTAAGETPKEVNKGGRPATKRDLTTYLVPDRLYTFQGFEKVTGICRNSLYRMQSDNGIKLKRYEIGNRRYIQGSDAIDFLKKIAAAEAKRKAG